MITDADIIGSVKHLIGHLEPVELAEFRLLLRGGVTAGDVQHALDAWGRTYHINDDWGWLRAVMLRRAADRIVLQSEVKS